VKIDRKNGEGGRRREKLYDLESSSIILKALAIYWQFTSYKMDRLK
jgi:hypothetical protein